MFTLKDRETGESIWTSDEESEPEAATELLTVRGREQEFADWLVSSQSWYKLSESELEHQPIVVTCAQDPAWNLVYRYSGHKKALERLASLASHTEKAEDPKVIGIFTHDDPDPVAIASPAEHETGKYDHLYTLEAKLRTFFTGTAYQHLELSTRDIGSSHDFGSLIAAIRQHLSKAEQD